MIDISFVRYFTIWSRNLGYCYAQPPVINVQPPHYAPNHHHHTWILQIGTLNTDSFWSISVCSQSFFSTCGLKSSAGADWRTPLTAEISTPLGSKFDFQDLPPWLHNFILLCMSIVAFKDSRFPYHVHHHHFLISCFHE